MDIIICLSQATWRRVHGDETPWISGRPEQGLGQGVNRFGYPAEAAALSERSDEYIQGFHDQSSHDTRGLWFEEHDPERLGATIQSRRNRYARESQLRAGDR
jgi:hypothetical protein